MNIYIKTGNKKIIDNEEDIENIIRDFKFEYILIERLKCGSVIIWELENG